MKRASLAALGIASTLVASSTVIAACYDPCGYPGITREMCLGVGGTTATGTSSGPGTPDAGCDGGPDCPCASNADCQALSTACQPHVCTAARCQKAATPSAADTPCDGPGVGPHCDGLGSCVSCSDGLQSLGETGVDCGGSCALGCDGAGCAKDDTCKSGRCAADACLKSAGTSCQDDAECATSRCLMGACATCSGASDCASKECDAATSRCKVPLGAPCADGNDCANGSCNGTTQLCQDTYQDMCASPEGCDTGYCHNTICFYCTMGAQCLSNECLIAMGSPAGSCALLQGAYCTLGVTPCASGLTCMGAPAKCLP